MKAITKEEIIDLMMTINSDGMDNSNYSVDAFVSLTRPHDFYGSVSVDEKPLQPGAYCVIWTDDKECGDFPHVERWIKRNLTDENMVTMPSSDYSSYVVVICLDLLGA